MEIKENHTKSFFVQVGAALFVMALIWLITKFKKAKVKTPEQIKEEKKKLETDPKKIIVMLNQEANEKHIKLLHPMFRDKVRTLITLCEKAGFPIRITSGLRTYDEQKKLYDQGRTNDSIKKKEKIVTNAKPGDSFHNFGLAIDVIPIINGKASYDFDFSKIAAIAKPLGFGWGGDWKSFKDKPHFEMNFGNQLAVLKKKYSSGNIKDGYVNVA